MLFESQPAVVARTVINIENIGRSLNGSETGRWEAENNFPIGLEKF